MVLVSYLTLLILGFAGIGFTARFFEKFEDKGVPFAKILSLVVISYVVWVCQFLFKFYVSSVVLWIVLIVFGVVSIAINFKYITVFSRKHLRLLFFEEILFAALFFMYILFRAANPRIEGIEKFMDFAIINGLHRGSAIPPVDVWYSGEHVNYYYFGHYVLTSFIKLIQIPTNVGYNIAAAALFAMVGSQVFSLGLNLTKKIRGGILALVLLVFSGNLDEFYNHFVLHKTDYFYAQARSLIPNTINEFPLYSFLISDLHAHIINIVFVLLFLAFLIYWVLHRPVGDPVYLIAMSSILGVLGVVNTWDLVIYGMLMCLVFSLSGNSFVKDGFLAVLLGICAVLFFAPFYLNFQAPVQGVLLFAPKFDFAAIAKMFGVFLFPTLMFILLIKYRGTAETHKVHRFGFIVGLFVLCLIALPGFLLVKDIYFKLNPPFASANTYFKVWYQAWILLSVFTPLFLQESLKKLHRFIPKTLFLVAFCFMLVYCVMYTVHSVKYIVGSKYVYKGLDGSSYLDAGLENEKAAINWLNKNVDSQPVLLESYGDSYTTDSVVSSYTGLPTIIGWSNHELGWRGDWSKIALRMGDIRELYTTSDVLRLKTLLNKYDIKYVLLSNKERNEFGNSAATLLKTLAKPVFISSDTEIWQL